MGPNWEKAWPRAFSFAGNEAVAGILFKALIWKGNFKNGNSLPLQRGIVSDQLWQRYGGAGQSRIAAIRRP